MPNGRPRCGLRFQNPLRGPGAEFAGFILIKDLINNPVRCACVLSMSQYCTYLKTIAARMACTDCVCSQRTSHLGRSYYCIRHLKRS